MLTSIARPIANMETLAGLYYVGGSALGDIKTAAIAQSTSTSTWAFAYDGTNQQREVLLENGTGGRELYFYDSAGQRYMAVTFDSWDPVNPPIEPVPDRIRIWIGGAEIWYTPDAPNDTMAVQAEYAHLSLGGLPVGRVKTEGIVKTTEASFHNGLGHLMSAVDWDTGVVNSAFIYGPYGEELESIGGGIDDHLRRFNGKEADQLSKLSYYGYRYYDPLSLSWTQADPLYLVVPDLAGANPREMTLYAFSLNNPVRYVDPDGRAPKGTVEAKKGDVIKTDDPETIDESYCGRSDAPEDCAGVVRTSDGKLRWVHKGCDDTSHPNCGKGGTESEISLWEDGLFTGLVRAVTGISGLFDPKGDLNDKKAAEGAEIVISLLGAAAGGLAQGLRGFSAAAKGGGPFTPMKSLGAAANPLQQTLAKLGNKAVGATGKKANRLLRQMASKAGLEVKAGGKHLKVINSAGNTVTVIPHSPHAKGTIRGIAEAIMKEAGS